MAQTTIQTNGGTFEAYVSNKKNVAGPGLLLIQEIFGVNKTMRELADDMSLLGYVVVCPDIFWRIKPGIQLNNYTPDEWKQAFELFQKFDADKGAEDLKTTLAHMRRMPEVTGKVGCVGYCLGGKLAYLMMTRSNIDCGVSYYGVGIQDLLDEAKNIKNPYLMHIAGKDQFVPSEAQQKIINALKGNKCVTINVYPDQDHAFARVGGDHYDKEAATQANERTAAFLKQHLS
ncbi:MAG TPA: dienelactone hydrolase family protein [Alphaproteobacteria bacterium]